MVLWTELLSHVLKTQEGKQVIIKERRLSAVLFWSLGSCRGCSDQRGVDALKLCI